MKRLLMLSMAVLMAGLSSCSYDPYYGGGGSYPQGGGYYPPSNGNNSGSSYAYRTGHTDGARDKSYNRPYNPYRGQSSVPYQNQDSYRNGYAAGYRSGSGGGGNWGGGGNGGGGNWGGGGGGSQNQNYYNAGVRAGARDKRTGQTYNSGRHWGNVPAGERLNFNLGYKEGWARGY